MPDRKVIVITGASSGIGRALALEAANAGYAVLAVARNGSELERLKARIESAGGICVTVVADVTTADAAARIVEAAQTRFGRIDVLVHSAGAATRGTLLDQTDAQIDGQWQLHVAGPLRITRSAFPLLKASGGQVLFVGSGLRRVPAPGYGAYCAAKGAVETMAQQLRRELRGSGVAVTFVEPGSVRTNFAKNSGIPSYGANWLQAKPDAVAKRIMRALQKRQSRVLGVPWHTFGAVLGEWFPLIADRFVSPASRHGEVSQRHGEVSQRHGEASQRHGEVSQRHGEVSQRHGEVSNHPEESKGLPGHAELVEAPTSHPEPVEGPPSLPRREEPSSPNREAFQAALEPISRRMERVKLSPQILADLLQPGNDVHLGDAAMRWAGMPNKNERAAMAEALEALTAGGFLERTGDESWRVLRSAR